MKRLIYYIALPCVLIACGDDSGETAGPKSPGNAAIPVIQYEVLRHFPHDTTSYTEGFLFHKGNLFESTGSPENQPHLKSVIGMVILPMEPSAPRSNWIAKSILVKGSFS